MTRRKIIQLQATVRKPIGKIMDAARAAIGRVCLGVDDMQLLGNKALIFRAEITPGKLPQLFEALASLSIKLNQTGLPDVETLDEGTDYPLSIQITSFSVDTDRRANIPSVPG